MKVTWTRVARETGLARTRRARRMGRVLAEMYPDAHCALHFSNPLELLVATVLSAQCTDARVNLVTPRLFTRFPDAKAYAHADVHEVEELIRSTGFFRAKAAHIVAIGQAIEDRYDGEVPACLDELVTLPGVGRKTSNVVLGNAFGVPGLTIDTHFGRLARRFGWTQETDPVKVESAVGKLFPPSDWTILSHRVIAHGRTLCTARRPKCERCPLRDLCPSSDGTGPSVPRARSTAGAARRAGQAAW